MSNENRYSEARRATITQLSEDNAQNYARLSKKIGRPVPLDDGAIRREQTIEMLEDLGIISADQRLDYEENCQLKIREVLAEADRQITAQEEAVGQQLTVVQKPSKLTDAHGNPLH